MRQQFKLETQSKTQIIDITAKLTNRRSVIQAPD
jgi:hypothetical protein